MNKQTRVDREGIKSASTCVTNEKIQSKDELNDRRQDGRGGGRNGRVLGRSKPDRKAVEMGREVRGTTRDMSWAGVSMWHTGKAARGGNESALTKKAPGEKQDKVGGGKA